MPSLITLPLPYARDSHRLMSCLAVLERPVFLDSSLQQDHGRFDILAAEPVAWIQISAGSCQSSDPSIAVTPKTIFKAIRLLQEKTTLGPDIAPASNPDLPFQGGLLGYLGYPELSGRSELSIRDAYIGAYRWAVIVDHQLQISTVVLQPACPEHQVQRLQHLLLSGLSTDYVGRHKFELVRGFERQVSRTQYEEAFHAIKQYIREGDCYQVNLTQEVTATCAGIPYAAYQRLRQTMPAPFSAFIAWPDGALLSVSPERFLRKQGLAVLTQPIKGTRPRAVDPKLDEVLANQLQFSEKDRAENLMIVDLLRNDLGRVCVNGSIQVNELFTLQSFSNVHHLVSSIRAQLTATCDAIDLLEACFPGGSITGAPKLRAMEIIQELETTPRRIYCGSVFYLSANGDMDSSITIRSLLWEAGKLHCWAGGGIVDDSESEAEYAECFYKITRIINTLSD